MENNKQKIFEQLKICLSDLKKLKGIKSTAQIGSYHNKVSKIFAVNEKCILDAIDIVNLQKSAKFSKYDFKVLLGNMNKCYNNYIKLGEIANELSKEYDIGDFNNLYDGVVNNVESVFELVKEEIENGR